MKISYPLNMPFHISQRWGENPDYYSSNLGMKGHNGVDFACPTGTPVYACHDGTIQFSGIDSVRSLTVCIDTPNGLLRTLYCHLSESKVKVGQVVKRGELIALSGNTGSFTTGPHLHLGVRPLPAQMDNGWNGAANPFNYFDGSYPNSFTTVTPTVPTSTSDFLEMQAAILKFQLSEGITVFKDKPLNTVKYGPSTLSKALKYLK